MIQHRHLGFSEAWNFGDSMSMLGGHRKASRSFTITRAWGTKSYFSSAMIPNDFGVGIIQIGNIRKRGPFGGRYDAGPL